MKILLLKQPLFILICILIFPGPLPSQSLPEENDKEDPGAVATLYQIKLSRLQRLLNADSSGLQEDDITFELQSLVKDAVQFADLGLYDLAAEFLDQAITISGSEADARPGETAGVKIPSGSQWNFAAFMGTEFWRQKFGLVFAENDSTLYEKESNPFAGFRVMLDKTKNTGSQTQWLLEGKLSNEYLSGQLLLDYYKKMSGKARVYFRNSIEGASYKDQPDLRYIDDRLDTDFFYNLRSGFILGFENEMQYRRYASQSLFFSNYFHNQARISAALNLKRYSRAEFVLEHRLLNYGYEELRDYNEFVYGLNIWPALSGKFSLAGRVRARTRDYVYGYIDSLYTNNFNEFYGSVDMDCQFTDRMELNLEFEFEKRNYEMLSTVMPDYTDFNIEPSFGLGIGSVVTLYAGYRFRSKYHNLNTSEDESAQIEDYYSHGPVITLDMYLVGGFLASLSNSYQRRRYPNYSSYDDSGFSLYSNRDIHSLFFYLTWSFTRDWELNVMSMFDYDRETSLENGDTNSILFNFELSYKF